MHRICLLVVCCIAVPAFCQKDSSRVEVFGGYSYLHLDTQGITGATLDTACNNILGGGTCPAGSFQVHQNFSGWNASAQANLARFWGIKADLSGHYGTPVTTSPQIEALLTQSGITGLPPKARSHSYLFGPVIFQKMGRYRPFAHALFGANTVSTNLSGASASLGIPGLTLSDTAFAMAFGGGIDVKLTEHASLRVGQLDYLFTKHDFSGGVQGIATHQSNLRASVGIVFQFGGRPSPSRSQEAPRLAVSPKAISVPVLGLYAADGPNSSGAFITEVSPYGAAASAGLHPGDIINSVNAGQIKTSVELAAAVSGLAVGAKVRLGLMIQGQWQSETTVVVKNQ